MRGVILRADLRNGQKPLITRHEQDWPDLTAALTLALTGPQRLGRKVWVLDSAVWLGVVELPSASVAGLTDHELIGPVEFEAEALSEIAPHEAVTAVQRRRMANQEDQFLVTQVKRTEIFAIAKAVRQAGGHLAGLGHPAGLAPPIIEDEPKSSMLHLRDWRSVEFWHHEVVLCECINGHVNTIPLGTAPDREWRRALDPFLRQSDPLDFEHTLVEAATKVRGGSSSWRASATSHKTTRWLRANQHDEDDIAAGPVCQLSQESQANLFLSAWAEQLVHSNNETPTPFLRPPKTPAARWPIAMVGALAFAAALGLVAQNRQRASEELTNLQGQLQHAQQDQRRISELGKRVKNQKSNVQNKEQELNDLRQEMQRAQEKRLAAQTVNGDRRAGIAAMMQALTTVASLNILVQSIKNNETQHEINGIAATPTAAIDLARGLSQQLSRHAIVHPANIKPITGREQIAWRFAIKIEPNFSN
jgi:hypothetical protein